MSAGSDRAAPSKARALSFPMAILSVGVAVTVLLFALVGKSAWTMYAGFRQIEKTEMRLQHLSGVIIHLDEVLTMSARMCAATGDLAWEQRYRSYEPQLDAAIRGTIEIVPDVYERGAARLTDEANRRLVAMENRAFAHVRAGRRAEAAGVLFSEEYETQKRIYKQGMDVTNATIQRRIHREVDRYAANARRVVVLAIPAILVLAAGWVGVLLLVRRHIAQRVRAEEEAQTSRSQIAQKQREMEIAARIQTSILPRAPEVEGLEVAGAMTPATEVGGDYYDVLPTAGGCWVGVGDVAGHGVTSGLIMLMVQSALSALVRRTPGATPRETVCLLNEILYENVRGRLGEQEHVTLSLLRYHDDGRLVFAGAHEDIVVCRAKDGSCEILATPGTWMGVIPSVEPFTQDGTCVLEEGDLVVLYTDGVTEAMDARGRQFGLERLCDAVTRLRREPTETIRDAVLEEVRQWTAEQTDDVTILVLRHVGRAGAGASEPAEPSAPVLA